MTRYTAATPGTGNEAHTAWHPHSAGDYSPPTQTPEATGTRALSIEDILHNCGSGSRWDTAFTRLREHIRRYTFSGDWLVQSFDFREEEAIAPPTVGEKLDQIRESFGLSMSALADILQSSRASVYNWFETDPRSAEILERIETLAEFAQKWQSMNPYHYAPGKLMKQKLGDGPSMLERLSRDVLDRNEIQNGLEGLLVLMKRQRERIDRAKARSAKLPADSESHKELLERLTGSVTADK